jgi:cytochrome c oxidase subunit 3
MVAVGTIVWLSSELMFFAALFAIYFTLRSSAPELWSQAEEVKGPGLLNLPFSAINTTILVLSSLTCQLGVFAAERGQARRRGGLAQVAKWGLQEWFLLTLLMGSVFVAGQIYEYTELVHEGLALHTNAYSSIFYLATGIHGLHVTGGLVAFLLVLGRVWVSRRFDHRQATSAIVVSYYWHFVDVVWVVLFSTIYLLK